MAKRFAKALEQIRILKDQTIDEVSEATKISPGTIYKYETSRIKIEKQDGIILAEYYEVDPYLFGVNLPMENKYVARNFFSVLSLKGFSLIKGFKTIFNGMKQLFKRRVKKIKKPVAPILETQLFSLETEKKQPFMYRKIILFLLALAGLSSIAGTTVMINLSLSLIVPFGLMWYLLEKHHPRLITGYDIIKYFLFGGLLSIIVTYVIRLGTGYVDVPIVGELITGLVEELAKALIVIFLLRKLRIQHMLFGVLIGFAVGAGFSVIETMDYGIYAFYDTGVNLDMSLLIIMRSIFSLFGTDHTFWTAILGGVLVAISKTGVVTFKDLKKSIFIMWYLVVALIHATYNILSTYSMIYLIPLTILSLFIFLMVWNKAKTTYYIALEEKAIQLEETLQETDFLIEEDKLSD